jgi:hypothetical protein
MYRAEEILARLKEKPFRPLRIIASEGLRFDIHHPDLVLVGNRDLMIGTPASKNPSIYDKMTRVALVHVVALEDLPPQASSVSGNGQDS